MRKLTLLLAPLFLLAACSEPPTNTSTQDGLSPAFDFSNGPAEPGHSYIVRDAYGSFGWFFLDPQTNLAAYVTDFEPCLDLTNVTLIPTQSIFSPGGEGLLLYFEGGWVNAAILAPPYGCDDVLATGQVRNVWHDNDFYAPFFDHHRANSYGGALNGRVGDYTLSYIWHVVWGGPTKPDFHGEYNERISIK